MNFKQCLLTTCCLLALARIGAAEQTPAAPYSENGEETENIENAAVNIEAEEESEQEERNAPLVDLEIKGIEERDSDAWTNVQAYLGQISNEYADGSERHQYLVQTTVDKALRAKGYYNTQYQFVQTPRSGRKALLTLHVGLDKEKVKIDETEIKIDGEAETDEDFVKLIAGAPKKGIGLDHGTYDDFKSDLDGLAFKKGYFDGHWLYHHLEVYPRDHAADWRLGYSSGRRYRYGKIELVDHQIKEEYLRNILRVKSGDPYDADDLSKMMADYSSSNWFSSVLVEPAMHEDEKLVDLNVFFQPKKKNEVEVGIGFATDDGPRFQLNWKKPWLNDRGHSIESRTYISSPEQTFEFGYNIPLREKPLHYYYQFSGALEHEDRNDTKSTAATVGFQRFWTHETGWSFSAGLKARYDSFTQANESHKTLLIYPTASLNRTRSDGNRFPLWGDSQRLTVNWGTRALASDVNFFSYKLTSSWIRTYFNNHRFYLRGEVGHIHSNDFRRIPPALRYFAGGDMSIRGFGYKDISPKDPVNGKLVGGSHLATGTAEYQYQVYPDWWAAVFYDTGLASNKFKGRDLHSGAGVGVRWASPIGAIKLDIAAPVRSPNNESGLQFYIGLGSEL